MIGQRPRMPAMEPEPYDPVKRYPPSKHLTMVSGSASFPLLELILDPTRTPPLLLRNAVLVSIDLESRIIEHLGERRITQIGIASFDTRVLSKVDIASSEAFTDAIKCRVFNSYPKRASKKSWTPKFLWGMPEEVSHDKLRDKLNEVFFNTKVGMETDYNACRDFDTASEQNSPRNVILIGHSIRSDRSLLMELLDFDIKQVPSIRAILDTGRMICIVYDFGIATHSHFNLRWMLRCLGVRYDQIHNAGNDAMFAMKALLLMFSNWKHQKGRHFWNTVENLFLSSSPQAISIEDQMLWDCQLEVIVAIARESWPVPNKSASCRNRCLAPSITGLPSPRNL